MSLSVAEILDEHVTFELESIDRMYLNVYIPRLQSERGIVGFFRDHRGHTFASSALMAPMSAAFVASVKAFCHNNDIPLVAFKKGERKDDVAATHRARFEADDGVVFVGVAQEKTPVVRTQRRRNPATGQSYAWLYKSTAMVNAYYFYCIDKDFGPFFIKFASYFPYNAKVCINGHEWLKRQATRRGIAFEAMDNGIASSSDPKRIQALAHQLSARKIEVFVRRWLRLLPHPFTRQDRAAGYHYDISVLQAEFSLTQVLDRPLTGRVFFEEVIRENLDIGRPDRVALIFDRKVIKTTPGTFRTRVITAGVAPYLYVNYKHSHIKQYLKEGRALRTETVVNNTRDFAVAKRLHNLPALREVGFYANRRLLSVQRISHDCAIGEDAFYGVTSPVTVSGQRASALRFGDPRAQALLAVLVSFTYLACGFSNKDMRRLLADLLGIDPSAMTQGRMTYDLRRLRLHGLIERIDGTHRYRVTDFGLRTALFLTRTYARLLRPGLAEIVSTALPPPSQLRSQFDRLHASLDKRITDLRLAA
ncbi:MAG TPA: hypothetical protein VFF07_12785 [Actinomycetota bacterium]|nr:hypothetical protein [Actinomycetota bacterium]